MTISSIPDNELLRRVVRECRDNRVRKGVAHARWTAIMDNFLLGSTYSRELCIRFGFDPDEMVKR